MTIEKQVEQRSQGKCELCQSDKELSLYSVPPATQLNIDYQVMSCQTCLNQMNNSEILDINHWRHLPDAMWSTVPAIQAICFRMLTRINEEFSQPWAQDALDILYLDDELLSWAKEGLSQSSNNQEATLDSNGTALVAGDNVSLIKDLVVKGANFTAKRGTAVRGISLTNNPLHIEGRVNGVRVVLIAAYLKKM